MSNKNETTDFGTKLELKEFFRFTRNGKMKSGTIVYSFSFALLYLIVYGAAYYFLIDPLASLTKYMSVDTANLIAAVVPAIAGAFIFFIPMWFLKGIRRPAFLGYIWTAAFAVVFYIGMAVQMKDSSSAFAIFRNLFLSMVPAPLLFGGGSAWLMYKKQ